MIFSGRGFRLNRAAHFPSDAADAQSRSCEQ
jgi:hypothetical protein